MGDPRRLRQEATALVRELLERLEREDVRELAVTRGELRVRVRKGDARPPREAHLVDSGAAAAPTEVEGAAEGEAALVTVKSPLTGIFYRGPSPQATPFVQIGSTVSVGQVIGLIEAMKLFNEIRSTAAGRVVRILAESGQLVRAHAPLIEVAAL
jgi:acetyl-CoA carboxylase biotin carboxyl carrier protein